MTCRLRNSSSDWIIFRELFYYGDYSGLDQLADFSPCVIYDLGANVGLAAIYLKLKFPNSVIYGFEPGDSEWSEAENNYRINNIGKVFNVGVGSEDAILPFHSDENLSAGQSFVSELVNRLDVKLVEKKVVNLDRFALANDLPMPDLLKIDVEGFECETLKGASKILDKVNAVVMETHSEALHQEAIEILTSHGLDVVMDELRYDEFRIVLAVRKAVPALKSH